MWLLPMFLLSESQSRRKNKFWKENPQEDQDLICAETPEEILLKIGTGLEIGHDPNKSTGLVIDLTINIGPKTRIIVGPDQGTGIEKRTAIIVGIVNEIEAGRAIEAETGAEMTTQINSGGSRMSLKNTERDVPVVNLEIEDS